MTCVSPCLPSQAARLVKANKASGNYFLHVIPPMTSLYTMLHGIYLGIKDKIGTM
ncbi:hypothetical protein PMEGAPR236_26030 [Priestia megaterium]